MAARGVPAVTAVALAAAALASAGGAQAKAPKAHLSAFPSCSSFVHYTRRHALRELKTMGTPIPGAVFPERGPVPQNEGTTNSPGAAPETAPVAGQDYSTTNAQEAGVDEPDMVKTDGKTIFAVENQRLYAVDASSDPPKLLDSIPVDSYGSQLLLDGHTLLVLGSQPNVYTGGPVAALAPIFYGGGSATLTEVDASDPAAMKVVKTMSVNGSYLDARMTGHTARVVFSAIPQAIPVLERAVQPPEAQPASTTTAPRKLIAKTTTPNWRPTYVLRRGRHGHASRHALVRCTSIRRPVAFSGLDSLTVLTIDLSKGLDPVDSDGVMTDGQIVYGSPKNLYVATQKAIVEEPQTDAPPPPSFTEIHKFDVSDPDQTTYEGSGTVSGTLLNNYAMSEQDGLLRVASTELPLWWNPENERPGESFVTVLAQHGDGLATVGRVGNLGKGQRIYAVRFIGDVGYVVTFRQVDPLYTIGLSDPEHPRVLGSVDLLGYSAYLHPVGDGLLLGIGQAASDQGRLQGTQLTLFDVSDPSKPAAIAQKQLGNSSSSSVEFDPHAFLWWDPSKLAVMPVQIYDYNQQNGSADNSFTGAIGFHVTKQDGISEAGRVTHPGQNGPPPIDRSLVIGNDLFTVSVLGVRASDLGTFADHGFAQFPEAANPSVGSGTSGTGTSPPGQPTPAPG